MSFTMFCGVITSELEYFEMPVMAWNLSNKSSIGTPSPKSHFLLNISKIGFKTAGKHRLTRAHREKQLKMSCQALHNAPPNRT